jgi:hypothetical protein
MLESNRRRLLDPEHGRNAEVSITRWAVINALDSSPGGISRGGPFIGVVRGLVLCPNGPRTTPFTLSAQS